MGKIAVSPFGHGGAPSERLPRLRRSTIDGADKQLDFGREVEAVESSPRVPNEAAAGSRREPCLHHDYRAQNGRHVPTPAAKTL